MTTLNEQIAELERRIAEAPGWGAAVGAMLEDLRDLMRRRDAEILRQARAQLPDLEPDDGLGPTLSGPRGYMSEATHLTRRVLLLERTIRDAKAELDKSPQWGEHEARAYRILDALPIPER